MTTRQFATSTKATDCLLIVSQLQQLFAESLAAAISSQSSEQAAYVFKPIEWLRDLGQHGGGLRMASQHAAFNTASINVSQIFYEDLPEKTLNSATALSTIIHPAHPLMPSMHMHLSFTELKSGKGYFRMMADLNPSHANKADTDLFKESLQACQPDLYQQASEQGDHYFFIPALNRHRGVSHYYLEQFDSGHWQQDLELMQRIGNSIIQVYCKIIQQHLKTLKPGISSQQQQTQLAYHSLYFLQVLTLDRGTTSGLMVHNQNDVGTLASLPKLIDYRLLQSWIKQLPNLQQPLLSNLLAVVASDVIEGKAAITNTQTGY